jgi:hypothetical protein
LPDTITSATSASQISTRESSRQPAKKLGHRAARPGDDGWHELSDDDSRVSRQLCERCAEGEAHTEPTDQHAWLPPVADFRAGQPGERLLGAAQPAVHQLVGAEHDGKFAAAALQPKFLASAGNFRRIEL